MGQIAPKNHLRAAKKISRPSVLFRRPTSDATLLSLPLSLFFSLIEFVAVAHSPGKF